jgi:hypothetical protein
MIDVVMVRARAVLIVEGMLELIPLLSEKNFFVVELGRGTAQEGLGCLLAHRALITRTPDLWREQAAILEFSVVDLSDQPDLPMMAAQISACGRRCSCGGSRAGCSG